MVIEAVFFDFGGVIGRLDRDEIRRLESSYGLKENDLLRSIYGIPEWRKAEIGRIPTEEWIAAANRALDEKAGKPVPQLHEDWRQMWQGLDEDVVELARALGSRYRVGMISNTTKRLEKEMLEPSGLSDLFEIVVNSARLGIAKPDTRIYHHAADQMNVGYSACVHIDDLQPNIDGAIAAGFSAIHYEGHFPALEKSLRALGVEW
ncbi:MAG: HAD family phosphatase [Chloroflexi bacterium]|nr:HAD family phosphatase [Chloroflexota bacterium]